MELISLNIFLYKGKLYKKKKFIQNTRSMHQEVYSFVTRIKDLKVK